MEERETTMTTIQKIINVVLVIAVLALGLGSFHSKTLGDSTVENYPVWFYNGTVIGPQNVLTTQIIHGTCTLAGAVSMGTLTNAALTCAAPGAKVGDQAFLASTDAGVGATTNSGFPIIGAKVTANDVITATLVNSTGGTNTPGTTSITGIQYFVIR